MLTLNNNSKFNYFAMLYLYLDLQNNGANDLKGMMIRFGQKIQKGIIFKHIHFYYGIFVDVYWANSQLMHATVKQDFGNNGGLFRNKVARFSIINNLKHFN